jgi:hypothetical protein
MYDPRPRAWYLLDKIGTERGNPLLERLIERKRIHCMDIDRLTAAGFCCSFA